MSTVANPASPVQHGEPRTTRQALALELLAEHRGYVDRARRVQNHLVAAARREGLTWAEIAVALGTRPDALRKAMVKAQAEAS